MNRPYLAWYVPIALLAIVPLGARLLSWTPRPQPVDPAMAEAGETLFHHEWTPDDPLSNGGDGLGPVFNATSCFACHHQGRPGGGGGLEHNVTTFTVRSEIDSSKSREGVIHARANSQQFQENLTQVHADLPASERPDLRRLQAITSGDGCHGNRFPQVVSISQRNTPPLFGAKLIDDIPDRVIIAQERSQRLKWGLASSDGEDVPVGRALRLANGRVGHFGWKGQIASLSDFVQTACANELGLSNPDHPQPRPLGWPADMEYAPAGLDLTLEQCNQLTAFIGNLPRPTERVPPELSLSDTAAGRQLFHSTGCVNCHTPDLGSVSGLYSDLLLHNMGQPLVGGGSYGEPPIEQPRFKAGEGPQAGEWRTPPLWGVADSAPYLHDGRAPTLRDAILLHAGQGMRSANQFKKLSGAEQSQLVAFLQTLRAP
jgi:CxxC motif-containing protein (DUF1111 family)